VAKSSSKILSADERLGIERWRPPQMENEGERARGGELTGSLLTASQLEQLQKQAFEEGFEQGKSEGFEYGHKEALVEGRNELRLRLGQFEALLSTLDTPLENLDDQVERELIELVISMVRQLVRREVKADPGHIIGVVREALAILPVSSRNIRVVLHPEDAELVRQIYEFSETELGWKVVEDPVLARGGCRILTDTSQVDATLESRLATLVAPLLGDERELD